MPGVFLQQRDVSSGLFGAKRNFLVAGHNGLRDYHMYTPFRLIRVSPVYHILLLMADLAHADRSSSFPNSPERPQVTATGKKQ